MPFPVEPIRFQLTFSHGTSEIVVQTLHAFMGTAQGDWHTPTTADLQKAADLVRTQYASHMLGGSLFAATLTLQKVDAYTLNVNTGKAQDKVTSVDGTSKGTATSELPPEVAVAVTLQAFAPGSFVASPRRSRGRMYLGGLGASVMGADGLLTTGGRDGLMTNFAGFLNAVRAVKTGYSVAGVGTIPCIASRAGNTLSEIRWVRVDNLFDVQRRRQNNLPHAWNQTQLT